MATSSNDIATMVVLRVLVDIVCVCVCVCVRCGIEFDEPVGKNSGIVQGSSLIRIVQLCAQMLLPTVIDGRYVLVNNEINS